MNRFLLSNNPLQIFDLHENAFICECNLEGYQFQKWFLTDDEAYLWNNFSEAKCVDPRLRERLSMTEIDLVCKVPNLSASDFTPEFLEE